MWQQLLSNANRGWLSLGLLSGVAGFRSCPNLTVSGRLLCDIPCNREGRRGRCKPVSRLLPAWVKTAQRKGRGRGFLYLGRDVEVGSQSRSLLRAAGKVQLSGRERSFTAAYAAGRQPGTPVPAGTACGTGCLLARGWQHEPRGKLPVSALPHSRCFWMDSPT